MHVQVLRCVFKRIMRNENFAPGPASTDGEASKPGPRMRRRGPRSNEGEQRHHARTRVRALIAEAKALLKRYAQVDQTITEPKSFLAETSEENKNVIVNSISKDMAERVLGRSTMEHSCSERRSLLKRRIIDKNVYQESGGMNGLNRGDDSGDVCVIKNICSIVHKNVEDNRMTGIATFFLLKKILNVSGIHILGLEDIHTHGE